MPTGSRPAQISNKKINNNNKEKKKKNCRFGSSFQHFFLIIIMFMRSLWAISAIAYNRLCFYDSAARFW